MGHIFNQIFSRIRHSIANTQSTITPILMIIMMLIALGYTTYSVSSNSQKTLLQKSESLAHLIDAAAIKNLKANEEDEGSRTYTYYKTQFQHIKSINPEIKFIYLMRKNGEKVVFLLDSVPEGGEDYSPPGQEYPEASEKLKKTFTSITGDIEIERDRWGYWLSSFAPIINDDNGEIIGVLGIDVDFYSQFLLPIIGYNVFVLIIFALLIILMIINRGYTRAQTKALEEKNSILHVTSHEVRTPLTKIRWATEIILEGETDKLSPEIYEMIKQTYISTITMIERINILSYTVALSDDKSVEFEDLDLIAIYLKMESQLLLFARLHTIEIIKQGDFKKPILVNAHDKWLEIMFVTLIMNAVMYADPKSQIITSIKNDGKDISISIESIGKELPKDQIAKLFDGIHADTTLGAHTEATGMGLYLVPRLASLMNGSLTVEAEGKTTRFILKLPVV